MDREAIGADRADVELLDVGSVDFAQARAGLAARGPGRMVPGIGRMQALVELLGDPQQGLPLVHVTGTNGKTSTTRMVAALTSELGLTTGTFTSPHLQSVTERIQVGLQPIARDTFARAWAAVESLARVLDATSADDPDGEPVTYFELTAAMALWLFNDLPVDLAVLEVGMGGRWDATNVADGDVAVLTPIDVDHSELGSTPAEVAGEKVGIVKPGAAVVVGRQPPEVQAIVDEAVAAAGGTQLRWGDDVEVVERAVAVGGQQVALRVGERVVDDVFLPLHGAHQAGNAALALAAVAALLGPRFAQVDDDVLRAGFLRVTTPGRMEVVARSPTVVVDGAHNPHGAAAAARTVDEAFSFRNVVLVVAVLADKDAAGIVAAWRDVVDHVVVTEAPSPRTLPLAQVAAVAAGVFEGTGVAVEQAATVAEALELARGVAHADDGIVVTGSLYAVAAAREATVARGSDA